MHSFMTSLWFTHRWRTNNCRVLKKNRKIKLKIIFLIWSDQQCRRPEPPFRSGSGSASSPTFRERQGCQSLSEPRFLGGAGARAEFSSRLRFRLQLSCQYRKKIFFVVPTKKLKISVFSVIFALNQFSKKLKNLHLLLIFVSVKKKTKNVQFFPLTLGVGVGVGAGSGFGNLPGAGAGAKKVKSDRLRQPWRKKLFVFLHPIFVYSYWKVRIVIFPIFSQIRPTVEFFLVNFKR